MKQIRIIAITIPKFHHIWDKLGLFISDVKVEVFERQNGPKGFCVFLTSEQKLQHNPKKTKDQFIIVDETLRKKAEYALENFANIISVLAQSKRTITSPEPCFAYIPENDADREFLASCEGIRCETQAVAGFPIEYPPDVLRHINDRLDGYSLMAEAFSNTHALGKFNEFFRLFERAFKKSSTALEDPLYEFLTGTDFSYSKSEIEDWIEKRHKSRHADVRNEFMKEYQILPIIQRVEQAAFDVLLNKKDWRSPSKARRQVWKPKMGTNSPNSSLFCFGPPKGQLKVQCFDDFGVYPANLENKFPVPDNWFFKKKLIVDDMDKEFDKLNIGKTQDGETTFEVNLLFPKKD